MRLSVSGLQEALAQSRSRLFQAIHGLNEEQFRHERDGWSAATHLTHLLRVERIYVDSLAAALRPALPAAPGRAAHEDDRALAQRLAVPQVVHGLLNVRRELETQLAACDDAALARPIPGDRQAAWTVGALIAKAAAHEEEHTAAIVSVVKSAPASARVIIPLAQRS